jgi:adenylate cyclase
MERAILYDDRGAARELQFLEGATVIVGVTDPSLMDLPATPVHPRFPGPEIQATALDNFLRGEHVTRSQRRWEILAAAGLALLGALVGLRLRPGTGAVLGILAAALFGAFVFLVGKSSGLWFGAVMPFMALAGSYGTGVTVERLAKEREQRLVKDTFGKYVAPNILDDLLEDPKSILSRKGQKKEISILFSDVKGFSALCEEHEAAGLLDQLNEYLSEMTEIVFKHGGTVDKFMGDGLMAFFGHPVDMEDHATRAVNAAREMQMRLASLREKWETEGKLLFQIRVGVNSGEVIAGSMGGGGKMDYTVFGRSVNLAQRLESNCDLDGVLVSAETLDEAGIGHDAATPKTIEAKNIGTLTAYQIPVA